MDWLAYSLITALGTSSFVIISKFLTKTVSINTFIFYLFVIETPLFFLVSDKSKLVVTKTEFGLILLCCVLCFITNIADQTAIKLSPNPGFPMAVRSVSIIIVAIVSAIIFNYSLSPRTLLGVTLTFIGLLLIQGGVK